MRIRVKEEADNVVVEEDEVENESNEDSLYFKSCYYVTIQCFIGLRKSLALRSSGYYFHPMASVSYPPCWDFDQVEGRRSPRVDVDKPCTSRKDHLSTRVGLGRRSGLFRLLLEAQTEAFTPISPNFAPLDAKSNCDFRGILDAKTSDTTIKPSDTMSRLHELPP